MNHKRGGAYKQGVVTTTTHPVLKKGQIVDILFEGYYFYYVKSFTTSSQEKIEKKDLQIN
jgi:hypothetical protein